MTKPLNEADKIIQLHYRQGSIIAEGDTSSIKTLPFFSFDSRTKEYRALGGDYRNIILEIRDRNLAYQDHAKSYAILNLSLHKEFKPYSYQKAAIESWTQAQKRGVVALPTGAGKTMVAIMAIHQTQRSSLVIVPTIELLYQWRDTLNKFFASPIGVLGDGQRQVEAVTVATYDSARLMIENLGQQFGLLIFDECHHLPAPQYQFIALCAIAPYRLGLSATVERTDGKESTIYELVGPLIYEVKITDLVSRSLAPYDVVNIEVDLTVEERAAYTTARGKYLDFIRHNKINFSQKDAWQKFIYLSARSKEGKEALIAHRTQKMIAQRAEKKWDALWDLLTLHSQEKIIIFTDDNETAYKIGSQFLLPVITHKTKEKERKKFLSAFREADLQTLVTSKVLNEGVDVPEASIGIIISGSSTVREHVQRLGRILRQRPGKRATLYELVARDTNEVLVNKRRRQHDAYEKTPSN